MTSTWLVRRTLATFRRAEFGFFGVVVYTRVHTPRFCGQAASAGTLDLVTWRVRGLRTNWLIVGMFVKGIAWVPEISAQSQRAAILGPKHRPVKARRRATRARRRCRPGWSGGCRLVAVLAQGRIGAQDRAAEQFLELVGLAHAAGFSLAPLIVVGEPCPGGNQAPDDHVLLQAPQGIDLAVDGGFGQHPRGLLEGRRGDERVRGQRGLG